MRVLHGPPLQAAETLWGPEGLVDGKVCSTIPLDPHIDFERDYFAKKLRWIEYFSGSAMATRCITASGEVGCPLDIQNHEPQDGKQNFLDLLQPVGMATLTCTKITGNQMGAWSLLPWLASKDGAHRYAPSCRRRLHKLVWREVQQAVQ